MPTASPLAHDLLVTVVDAHGLAPKVLKASSLAAVASLCTQPSFGGCCHTFDAVGTALYITVLSLCLLLSHFSAVWSSPLLLLFAVPLLAAY